MICTGIKKDGNKCTYRAKYGNYCGIHNKNDRQYHPVNKNISTKDIFNAARKGKLSYLKQHLTEKSIDLREDGKNLLAVALINGRLGTARYLSWKYLDLNKQLDKNLPKYPGISSEDMFIFYYQMDLSFDITIMNRITRNKYIHSNSFVSWVYNFLRHFHINIEHCESERENCSMVDRKGNTFLHMIMRLVSKGSWVTGLTKDLFIQKLRLFNRKSRQGGDVIGINTRNDEGKTCLHLFCENFTAIQLDMLAVSDPFYHNKTFIGRLIDEGVDPTIEDSNGISVLQIPHVLDTYGKLLGKYYLAEKGMLKWSTENHRFFSRIKQRAIANLLLLNKRKGYFCKLVLYKIIDIIGR